MRRVSGLPASLQLYLHLARSARLSLWDADDGGFVVEFGRGGVGRTFHCDPRTVYQVLSHPNLTVDRQIPLVVMPRTVILPPGSRTASIYRFLFSPRVQERILDQILFDLREEYNESLVAGRVWHARWVSIRGIAALWLGMSRAVWTGMVRQLIGAMRSV